MTYTRVNSQNASVGDNWTAAKVNDINQDLDTLFSRIDPRDIKTTYDVTNRLTQIVDNINSITINLDWTEFGESPSYITIQEVGDPKELRIYYVGGLPDRTEYI